MIKLWYYIIATILSLCFSITNLLHRCNRYRQYGWPIDKVDCVTFELVGAVQVGKYENVGCSVDRQRWTQRFFTHRFQSLQHILQHTNSAVLEEPTGNDLWCVTASYVQLMSSCGVCLSPSVCHVHVLCSSSRMRVINHNCSATKQRLHPQSVAEISHHSVLAGDRIRQCETSSGSHHKDTDQCL